MSVIKMKRGALVYNAGQDRMDIRFGLDSYHGGLHCGETMDVFIDGEWIPTRIEKASDWFLAGIKTTSLPGLMVRK